MKKTVAVCMNTEIFGENKIFDYDFAKKYFGLLSMHYFHKLLPEFEVITGDVAIKLIREKKLNPEDVLVFQEQEAKQGKKLVELGAFAHTVFCLESQIYAKPFYQQLDKLPQKFKNRILFKGMFDYAKNCNPENNFHPRFPSYDDDDIIEPNPWQKRDFASLVMGNKFYVYGDMFPRKIRFLKILKWAFRKYIYKDGLEKYLEANELQNRRLEFVEYFGGRDALKLYGGGWDWLDNLPVKWERRLEKIVKKLNPKPVENKFEAISKCKYNICIENLSYKGYVTEKIIHSFVAAAIPVYLGAPDISEYIPANCFIDVRDFACLENLYDYMESLTEEKALEYIKNGREFLDSKEGKKYSFKNYAEFLAELVKG